MYFKKIFVLAMAAVWLTGCASVSSDVQDTQNDEAATMQEVIEEPISGGNTTIIDENAPKEIASKEITYFEASFHSNTRWSEDENNEFHFVISSDSGELTVTEQIRNISFPASEELLPSLQEIIDKYDLVSMNGVYDVTAGLAPDFFPGGITVKYASGEELTFTTDNNPYALWSEEMYDVLAAWFSENGDESLYPAKEDSLIERMNFKYMEGGKVIYYGGINVPDNNSASGKTRLLRLQNDNKLFGTKEIPFPDDYYGKITEIIGETDLDRNYMFSRYDHEKRNFGNHERGFCGLGSLRPDYSEPDSDDKYLDIYIKYESGHILNIETAKESEIEGAMPLIGKLVEYHESLR